MLFPEASSCVHVVCKSAYWPPGSRAILTISGRELDEYALGGRVFRVCVSTRRYNPGRKPDVDLGAQHDTLPILNDRKTRYRGTHANDLTSTCNYYARRRCSSGGGALKFNRSRNMRILISRVINLTRYRHVRGNYNPDLSRSRIPAFPARIAR